MSRPQRLYKGRIKARRVLKIQEQCMDEHYDKETYESQLHLMTHTRKRCSCAMCGNARKWFNEKTMQERKADVSFQSQLEDIA